jgi:hypothetical protein
MSKKRTMQIDVIEEVKGTQYLQCKLYIDGNSSVILMNKIDYERLLSDSFFESIPQCLPHAFRCCEKPL